MRASTSPQLTSWKSRHNKGKMIGSIDDTREKDNAGILRVYSGSINGLTLDRRGRQFDHYCTSLKEALVDVACGQEHNLDTIQSPIWSILYKTARQHWHRLRINFSTIPVVFKSQYNPAELSSWQSDKQRDELQQHTTIGGDAGSVTKYKDAPGESSQLYPRIKVWPTIPGKAL